MISIVIPIYNERPTLDALLDRVEALPLDKEILLVDDASTDGSTDLVRRREGRAPYRVLVNDTNRGKGYCVRRGIREARGAIVVIQDADLEYDPSDLERVVAPILEGHAEVVYGARFLDGSGPVKRFAHSKMNRFLTILSNLTTDLDLDDMETCYKAFDAHLVKSLSLVSDDFGIEPEITAKMARVPGVRVWQVPISYTPRSFSDGKKISWRDGVKALWYILRFGVGRR